MPDRNMNTHFSAKVRRYSRFRDITCSCFNKFPKLGGEVGDKITAIELGLKSVN